MNSVPSSMRIASRPVTWYWKCGARQLSVPAIGRRSVDQRQPGSNTSRPISASPTRRISARPFGNSRVSSGAAKVRCSVDCITISPSRVRPCVSYLLVDRLSSDMAETKHGRDAGTAERALDVAEALAQTRGFNGFSYAHVAAGLGITKASLHYHFPGKAELGEALITRYSERFAGALARIDDERPVARERLEAYIEIYADV